MSSAWPHAQSRSPVKPRHDAPEHLLGCGHVLVQVAQHHLDGDAVVVRVPYIIVGYAGERPVAQLRLARELRLGQRGHANDAGAPRTVHLRLRDRREGGALHYDVGAAVVHRGARLAAGVHQQASHRGAEGLRKADVRHDAVAKEGGHPAARPVDELVGDHHVLGRHVLSQASDRADGHDALDAERLEGVDVGTRRHLRRAEPVSHPVPRHERDGHSLEVADGEGTAGRAERRRDVDLFDVGQARHVVQARAADDADARARHRPPPLEGLPSTGAR